MEARPITSIETEFMVILKTDSAEFAGLKVHQHVHSADIDIDKGVETHVDCHIVVLDIDDIATIQHAIDTGLIPRTHPE